VAVLEQKAAQRASLAEAAIPHPLPDLTGASIQAIVDGLLEAIIAVHRDDAADADPSCAACSATIELASHYGDPTHLEWPDPVKSLLADTLDAELAARGAAPRWAQPPSDVADHPTTE
jgi:hypothetical protein